VKSSRSSNGRSWFWGIKIAVATGIAYFLAGRLGLVLRVEPGLAIFWPASGIAVGALIAAEFAPTARFDGSSRALSFRTMGMGTRRE
jgi:hypothetical protein